MGRTGFNLYSPTTTGHTPPTEHVVPSEHRLSTRLAGPLGAFAHGFTTRTRRRATVAAFPAESTTEYSITKGSPAAVVMAVSMLPEPPV
jgi:hypothetical protein